jgi:hypothetical protein
MLAEIRCRLGPIPFAFHCDILFLSLRNYAASRTDGNPDNAIASSAGS